jgi:hypothetical protein
MTRIPRIIPVGDADAGRFRLRGRVLEVSVREVDLFSAGLTTRGRTMKPQRRKGRREYAKNITLIDLAKGRLNDVRLTWKRHWFESGVFQAHPPRTTNVHTSV